jgi:hypothetical protein
MLSAANPVTIFDNCGRVKAAQGFRNLDLRLK